ncbi:MAG: hypothetical protein ACI82G_001306 [Bradymonadia bacterium]
MSSKPLRWPIRTPVGALVRLAACAAFALYACGDGGSSGGDPAADTTPDADQDIGTDDAAEADIDERTCDVTCIEWADTTSNWVDLTQPFEEPQTCNLRGLSGGECPTGSRCGTRVLSAGDRRPTEHALCVLNEQAIELDLRRPADAVDVRLTITEDNRRLQRLHPLLVQIVSDETKRVLEFDMGTQSDSFLAALSPGVYTVRFQQDVDVTSNRPPDILIHRDARLEVVDEANLGLNVESEPLSFTAEYNEREFNLEVTAQHVWLGIGEVGRFYSRRPYPDETVLPFPRRVQRGDLEIAILLHDGSLAGRVGPALVRFDDSSASTHFEILEGQEWDNIWVRNAWVDISATLWWRGAQIAPTRLTEYTLVIPNTYDLTATVRGYHNPTERPFTAYVRVEDAILPRLPLVWEAELVDGVVRPTGWEPISEEVTPWLWLASPDYRARSLIRFSEEADRYSGVFIHRLNRENTTVSVYLIGDGESAPLGVNMLDFQRTIEGQSQRWDLVGRRVELSIDYQRSADPLSPQIDFSDRYTLTQLPPYDWPEADFRHLVWSDAFSGEDDADGPATILLPPSEWLLQANSSGSSARTGQTFIGAEQTEATVTVGMRNIHVSALWDDGALEEANAEGCVITGGDPIAGQADVATLPTSVERQFIGWRCDGLPNPWLGSRSVLVDGVMQ